MEGLSQLAGVEECKGPVEGSTLIVRNDNLGGKRDQAILYVTVHAGDDSKVVPFRFSPAGNMAQVRAHFRLRNREPFSLVFEGFSTRFNIPSFIVVPPCNVLADHVLCAHCFCF